MAGMLFALHKKLLDQLAKRRLIHRTFLMLTGTGLAQVAGVLAAPILTRIYTPEQLGLFTIYMSFISVFGIIGALRLDTAILLTKDDLASNNLLIACLGVISVVSALSAAVIFVFGGEIASSIKAPQMAPILWTVPFGAVGAAGMQSFLYFGMRNDEFKTITLCKIIQGVGSASFQVGLGLIGLGPAGLTVGDGIGRNLSWLATAAILKRRGKFQPSLASANEIKGNIARYKNFPLYSSWAALINASSQQMPPVLISAIFGAQAAGFFGLGNRLLAIPVSLIGLSLSQVYANEASRMAAENPESLKRLFLKMTSVLFLAGSIPLFLLSLSAPFLFGIIFGEEWVTAGEYVKITALLTLFQFAVIPISQTLNILEHNALQLFWDITRMILIVAAFGATSYYGYSITTALWIYTAIGSFSMLLLFAFCYIAINNRAKTRSANV